MASRAAELDPGSSIALARAAELWMAEGQIRRAREAAERAVQRTPEQARALAVLGFVQLAQFKSKEALATLERAVEADPTLALARLGLGIARIRSGELRPGREEVQLATVLDPDNSLLRSYLGKAYYEEKRSRDAAKELATAKELDPLDPTPHLYDAILKQNENRPVEALYDLQRSVALNDRRAVYRSQMLLDQDAAVRSTDLARVYNDLGFEQLGLVMARRSADQDQSNYSAHNSLAGSYRNLPNFAPAFLSEVLQARIYQPINVNAARPDAVNESVSFNEYTALFDRPRVRGFAGAVYGETDTNLSNAIAPEDCTDFFGNPVPCCIDTMGNPVPCRDLIEIDDSETRSGDATLTLNRDRFAGAISYESLEDDGFRTNNDQDDDTVRAFFSFAPSYRDAFQLNYIDGEQETGDLPLIEFPLLVDARAPRFDAELTNIGLGYHRIISPAQDLAVSVIHSDFEQTQALQDPFGDFPPTVSTITLDGPQAEVQYVLRKGRATWIVGAGHFDGEEELSQERTDFLGTTTLQLAGDDTFTNAYGYVKIRELGPLELIAGAAWEDVTAPVGLVPPRDSLLGAAELEFEDDRISPKLGLNFYLGRATTLRAAGYYRLNPAIGRLQTLEPTQVSGFNQFFSEPGGTRSRSYGIGLDQEFGRHVFLGLSLLRRDLEIPEPTCREPDPFFGGCAGLQADTIVERDSDDWLGNLYLNAAVGKRVAVALEYGYEERDFDFTQVSPAGLGTGLNDFVRTQRLRPEVRAFFPFGFFLAVRGTRYDQVVEGTDTFLDDPRFKNEADFWIGDLELGYRLPNRWGSIVLEAQNFSDRGFDFYQRTVEEDIVPTRRVRLGARFTY
jgi:tetratricopeptide (TPR) repeat protein